MSSRMDIGLVVDATCDLSRALIDAQGLVLLPHALEFDHRHFQDLRDPAVTLGIYRRLLSDRSVRACGTAATVAQLRELFLSEPVLRNDRVLVLTASGPMHAHATEASFAILQEYRDRRSAAGRSRPFMLRVVDSGTVGAGLGALALAVLAAVRSGTGSFEELRRQTRLLAGRARCRLVPGDLAKIREESDPVLRAARRSAQSVPARWMGVRPILEARGGSVQVVGRVRGFEHAVDRVLQWAHRALEHERVMPVMALSIGGDPRIVREMAAYRALESLAATRRCDLQLSVMSATLAVSYGPGAFSLGVIDA